MSKVKEKSLVKPPACLFNHGGVMMWDLTSYLPARLVLCHHSSQRGFYVSLYLQSWQKGPAESNGRLAIVPLPPFILINNISVLLKAHHHKNFYGCRCRFNQPLSFPVQFRCFYSHWFINSASYELKSLREKIPAECSTNKTVRINIQGKKSREKRTNVLYLTIGPNWSQTNHEVKRMNLKTLI